MSSRVVRLLASWIALLAVVAVTFMPTITQALSATGDISVCSADSSRNSTPDGRHVLDHCPYCALHADLALPSPPAPADTVVAAAWRVLPAAFLRAPRASGVWVAAQARAPPRFV
jgi:hypothetical protein